VLPESFAAQLAQLVEPSDIPAVGAILREIAAAPEPELAAFLSMLAIRVRDSPAKLTGAELRSLREQATAAS
jgi:hypothetical protein